MKKIIVLTTLSLFLFSIPIGSIAVVLENEEEVELVEDKNKVKSKILLKYKNSILMSVKEQLIFYFYQALDDPNLDSELKIKMIKKSNVIEIKDRELAIDDLIQIQSLLNEYLAGNQNLLAKLKKKFESAEASKVKETQETSHKQNVTVEETESLNKTGITEESDSESSTLADSQTDQAVTLVEESHSTEGETDGKTVVNEFEQSELDLKKEEMDISKNEVRERPTSDIIESAPKGLSVDDILGPGLGNTNIFKKSDGTDVVVVTDSDNGGRGQTGGIWSNDSMRIDLKKPFKASMAIYFGSKGFDAADGMTFTLHNDPRGIKALGDGGGALGAYGPLNKPRAFYSEAIQNAFLLEFDTHNNEYFDRGKNLTDQHISVAYPHQNRVEKANSTSANTTTKNITQFTTASLGREMVFYHDRLWECSPDFFKSSETNQLSDGQWHDVEINYSPPTDSHISEFKLKFDGKEADLSREFLPKNMGIDLNSTKPANVYWGLTGSTGATGSTHAVVFKEVPGLMKIRNEGDIKSDGKSIASTTPLTVIPDGKELTYQSTLLYENGNQELIAPKIISSINSNVSYVSESYEVSVNGGDFKSVVDSDLVISSDDVSYQVTKNLSNKADGISRIDTRFKVKTKKVYDSNITVSEKVIVSGKNANFETADDSLNYSIQKMSHDGELILSEIDDNRDMPSPSTANRISGEITMRKGYGGKSGVIKFSGDPAIDGRTLEVQLKNDGTNTFWWSIGYKNYFTATQEVTAEFIVDGKVRAVGRQVVQDKHAPTADPLTLDYFVLNNDQLTEPPVPVKKFLKNLKDTNPTVKESDIKVNYVDPKTVLANMKTPGEHQVEILLEDPAGNKRKLKSKLRIHKNRLLLNAKDVTYNIQDLATKDNQGKLNFKDETVILKLLADNKELSAYYITNNGQQENYLDNVTVVKTDMKPTAGTYDVEISISSEELAPDGSLVEISTNVSFKLTITDGDLTYHVTNQMNLNLKLQTQSIDLPFDKEFKLYVKNNRFSTTNWQISARATDFTNQNNKVLPITLNYHDGQQKRNLTNREQLIIASNEKEQTLSLDNLNGNQSYFIVEAGADSINWADEKMKAMTTIEWNLTSVDDSMIENAKPLTKVVKEAK